MIKNKIVYLYAKTFIDSYMNTGIQITAKYYLLQWILWFIQPKVQINKKIHNIRWGTNYISLEEGEYLVEVYFNYFFGKACLGELNLALNEGETVKLYYHTPLFIFSSAILRIEGIDGPSMKKQPIQKAVNPNSPPVIKKTPPPIKNKKV